MVYRPQPEAGHDTSWWPGLKDDFEQFVRTHPRMPLPDTLTWEVAETRTWNRAHWLIVDKLGATPGDAKDHEDLNLSGGAPVFRNGRSGRDRPGARRQHRDRAHTRRQGVHAAAVARSVRLRAEREGRRQRAGRLRRTRREEPGHAEEVGRARQRSDDAVRRRADDHPLTRFRSFCAGSNFGSSRVAFCSSAIASGFFPAFSRISASRQCAAAGVVAFGSGSCDRYFRA